MIQKDKLRQAAAFMEGTDIDLWITLMRETSMTRDPVLPLIGDIYYCRQSAIVVERGGKSTAIVSFLEGSAAKALDCFDELVIYDAETAFEGAFADYLGRGSRKKIALNYSMEDPAADGISYGQYLYFMDLLKSLDYQGEVVSSSPILDQLRSVKCEEEVDKIRGAIRITQQIFDDAAHFIHAGTTEREIFSFFQQKAKEYGTYPSWELDQCPGVKVSLDSPSGHCGPTDLPAKPGCLVNVDFGVVYQGYCSDMQRMYYVLRENETDAPEEVKAAFYAVRDAIAVCKDYMVEGVTGFDTDALSRKYLSERRYKDYPHGLGHQVGIYVHDGGVSLSRRAGGHGPLRVGNVFAVEPATYIDAGYLCVEEMVHITPEGPVFLTEPQQELYLVR